MSATRAASGKFASFCQKLSANTAPTPFVFYIGENAEELAEILQVLRDKLSRQYGSCDEVHLSGLDNEAASWHAELMSMPMFPSGRLILVRHAEALLKRIEAQPKVLASYVRDFSLVPEFTVSLLQFKEKKTSKKLQALEELALQYEDLPLGPAELADQLAERAAALGYNAGRDVLELIVDKSAGVPKTVFANFDRLLTYRLHEKDIRIEDVEELVGHAESNMHFRLLDETARRNIAECLQILQLHALDDADHLIAALIRLFSEALRYHYYVDTGMSLPEIGQVISNRPLTGYPLKKSAERWSTLMHRYSPQGVRLVMEALLRADILCKENRDSAGQQVILTSFYLMLSKGV
jgi:DNA polymerase III delta subunit